MRYFDPNLKKAIANGGRCSLAQALEYRNDEITARFTRRYPVSRSEADELFEETKKLLWLGTHTHAPKFFVTEHILAIDEMWHNFICFTREYARYCETNFGGIAHHEPTTDRERARRRVAFETNPERVTRSFDRSWRTQLTFIAARLGLATVKRWYGEYPIRFARLTEQTNLARREP
jgi:hypothetical protein